MSRSPALLRKASAPFLSATSESTPASTACAEFQAYPAWRKKGDCLRCGLPSTEHKAKPVGGKQAEAGDKQESVLSKLPPVEPSTQLKAISARGALPPPPSGRGTPSSLSSSGRGSALPGYRNTIMQGKSNPLLGNSPNQAHNHSSPIRSNSLSSMPRTASSCPPSSPRTPAASHTKHPNGTPEVSLTSTNSSTLLSPPSAQQDSNLSGSSTGVQVRPGIVPVQPGKMSTFIASLATADLGSQRSRSSEINLQPTRAALVGKAKTLSAIDQLMFQSIRDDPYGMGIAVYLRTVNNLMNAMQLKEDVINHIEDLVARHRYNPTIEEKKLMQPISMSAQERLEKVVADLSSFIRVQNRLRQIIRVQSITRGLLARKRFKTYRELYIQGPLKVRNESFRELLRREKQYVANLELIVKDYMKPLKEYTKGYRALCSDKEISGIFGNIEALLTVHTEMLHQLEIIEGKCPEFDGLGEVFLTMAPFFKAYGDYVNNFQNGVKTLLECREKDRFAAFIGEIYAEHQKKNVYVDLHGLLATPLNHIAGYENLIMSLLDSTPVDHKDYRSLSHCFSIISGTSKYIRDCIDAADNTRAMQSIQEKLLKEKDKPAFLVASDHMRRFVKDGPCIILSKPAGNQKRKKEKERKAFLFTFNDIMLVTRPTKGLYKVIDRLDMDQVKLDDMLSESSASSSSSSLSASSAFSSGTSASATSDSYPIALSQGGRRYVFGIPSNVEKGLWVTELKRTIGYYEKTKIFGAPLSRLCDTASGIPTIVERLAARLDSLKAFEMLGIFRVSGTLANINFLRDTIDRAGIGREAEVNLAMSNVHDVSGVFKLFFREMPEPLLTYELNAPVLQLMSSHSSETTDNTLVEMAKLLQTLPKENLQLLFWLLRYLSKYLEYSEQSKMTSANISIVFSPNLCRPKQETIEYSLQLEKINNAFELMINHHQKLAELINPA